MPSLRLRAPPTLEVQHLDERLRRGVDELHGPNPPTRLQEDAVNDAPHLLHQRNTEAQMYVDGRVEQRIPITLFFRMPRRQTRHS